MTVQFLIGDVREKLREIPADSVDCVVTSPPYWGLRDYGVTGQIGLEPTLGEHLDVMVDVAREIRRVMKPAAAFWLNYGDVKATKPNGRSAAATKANGADDRTFRDKPFSTAGAIYAAERGTARPGVSAERGGFGRPAGETGGRVEGHGPVLKPKDCCLVPARLAIALQEDGWWVHKRCVWGKPNPMPDSSGKYRPSTAHEEIYLLGKSARIHYDATAVAQPVSGTAKPRKARNPTPAGWDTSVGDGAHGSVHKTGATRGEKPRRADLTTLDRGSRKFMADVATDFVETRYLRDYEEAPLVPESLDVWRVGGRPFREAHFATFPPELAARCILAGCPPGGTVLDPFGGAGTTGLVAERLGRNSILIELSPTYARMARRRIAADAQRRTAA
jgi:DNA modification methylase